MSKLNSVERRNLHLITEGVLAALWLGILNLSLFTIIFCAFDPRGANFLGGLVPLEYYNFLVGLVIFLFHAYLLIVLGLNVALTGSLLIAHFRYLTLLSTRELNLSRNKGYLTLDKMRQPLAIRHIFRCLQVLNACAMDWLGPFVITFYFLLSLLPMYCNFILFRYWSDMEPLTKAPLIFAIPPCLGAWSIVLELGGRIHANGKRVIATWRWRRAHLSNAWERQIMLKFARSCAPLAISYGKNFVVTRISLLKYHKGVARGVFRALITAKRTRNK